MSIVTRPATREYRDNFDATFGKKEEKPAVGKRTCNRHEDCDAADERAKAAGGGRVDHCHDDCCEDCFGS